MSLLVPELSQIVDRLLIVAPSHELLKEAFETLSFELTSDIGGRQKLNLAAASIPGGSVHYWTSFTLGFRAGSSVRISLVGVTLEALSDEPDLLGTCDGVVFFAYPEAPQTSALLKLTIPAEHRQRPWVTVGLGDSGENTLPSQALVEWLNRHLAHVRHLSEGSKTLTEGLEWVLSF